MICYQLLCESEHEFDGWFTNAAGFDSQAADGQITCPVCGSTKISKALMAPNIPVRSNARSKTHNDQAAAAAMREHMGRREDRAGGDNRGNDDGDGAETNGGDGDSATTGGAPGASGPGGAAGSAGGGRTMDGTNDTADHAASPPTTQPHPAQQIANDPSDKIHTMQREFVEVMRKLRQEVEKSAEYVGPRFAEEARKIHFDEAEPRGIYGEASEDEVAELAEEGVEFLPLPRLPEDNN